MLTRRTLLIFAFAVAGLSPSAQPNRVVSNVQGLKDIEVAAKARSDSVIAIPPAVSEKFGSPAVKHVPAAQEFDLGTWIRDESGLNGLASADVHPWHIVVSYDQFDSDGDNVHSGVFEEFWVSPTEYKQAYRSDNLNQTDYATAQGLFRVGDQRWPDRAQSQVRSEIIDPFYFASTLQGVHAERATRDFGGYNLECVLFQMNSGTVSDPTQYCFEPQSSILRYSRGWGWFQTVYNHIVSFQGRNIARDLEVTDGGKPYLKLHVDKLEPLAPVDQASLVPPHDANGPLGGRVSGVNPIPIILPPPVYPKALWRMHFVIDVNLVIGKDGRVVSAEAAGGPSAARIACEDAVRKWLFRPYLVLGKPVEVEMKTQCTNQ